MFFLVSSSHWLEILKLNLHRYVDEQVGILVQIGCDGKCYVSTWLSYGAGYLTKH